MKVLNQDGISLVDCEAISIDPRDFMHKEEDENKTIRIWGSVGDHDFVLGIYPNLVEAMAIIENAKTHFECKPQKVFVMPKSVFDKLASTEAN